MPLYLDRHEGLTDVTPQDVAGAHEQDLAVQERFGVRYLTYWFDPDAGSAFCLAEGPSKEAVVAVHENAHGLMATKVIEVEQGILERFLGGFPDHPPGTAYSASAVRAVLFTDICGSTELTGRLGDEAAMTVVRDHDAIVHKALESHGGRQVKHTGDGVMASFNSVSAAVRAAMAMKRELDDHNRSASEPFQIRIGISAGEPITEEEDLFGAVVQLASRLCGWASSGSIAVSSAVRDMCIGKKIVFVDHGTVTLKGFAEDAHVYEVCCT